MSLWRHEAFERFPEFRTELQRAKSPMNYWIDLGFAFKEAYLRGNIDLFRRILDYADWCFQAPKGKTAGSDLASCIFVCLFEHMPQTSIDKPIDQQAIARELLMWNGSTITHPHVKALYEDLVDRNKSEINRKAK